MKQIFFCLTLFFAAPVFAYTPYGEKQCEESDVRVDVYVSKDRFEPRVIHAKEGDKVCLMVHAVDYGAAFTVEGYPQLYVSVRPNAPPKMEYFKANKVGEFKINCKGGCALGINAKLIVQSKTAYEAEEERKYKKDSYQNRKNSPSEFDSRRKNY